jgi:hypothetical protein
VKSIGIDGEWVEVIQRTLLRDGKYCINTWLMNVAFSVKLRNEYVFEKQVGSYFVKYEKFIGSLHLTGDFDFCDYEIFVPALNDNAE